MSSISTPAAAPTPGLAQAALADARRPYAAMATAAIAAITATRLVWLAVQPADLYPDEAQYWVWAQHPALGYYSKPPLVAWVIALTTGVLGDGEFAIRVAAPLLHAAVAVLVYATAARLYNRRIAFWSALAYASLPGVWLSAFLMSTDAVLLPCWAAALYAFVRAREPAGERWWIAVGVAAGLGMLAKYAMAYWLISALGFLLSVREERRHLKPFCGAALLAMALYAPNLWWNWAHRFVSYRHVRDNAGITTHLFHPGAFLEFLASQFGVFGPIFFAILLVIAVQPWLLTEPRRRLLAVFALPTLGMMLAVGLLSRAQPNWAAPTYVSAVVLVVAWVLQRGWPRVLGIAVALNIAAAVCLFTGADGLRAAGVAVPAKYDPLHRLRGWRELGQQVGAELAAHPGLTLLADDRELIAALTYYVHPHPFDAVEWSPIPGIHDHWMLTNNIGRHRGADFLAVTQHGLDDYLRPLFAELTPLTTITTATGPAGGRSYALFIAHDYRGPAAP